jgi:putative AlgH/UPF0301 family transcriptional regulator
VGQPSTNLKVTATKNQQSFLRILYKGLLRKAKTFDNYPLLKAWCDHPFSNSELKKWYSPKISFYEEVRKAFRKPLFGPNQVSQAIFYATGIYKTWNNVYSLVSAKMINFDSYIKKMPTHAQELSSPVVPITLLDKIEPGVILIAHPRDEHPEWSKSIILIIKHNSEKTIGLMLNKRILTATVKLIENNNNGNTENEKTEEENIGQELTLFNETEEAEITPELYYSDLREYKLTFPNTTSPVYHGGPVKGIFLLHTRKDTPRSHLLGDGLFYSQINSFNSKIIRQIANTSKNYRLLMGYAEWAPGQLMTEIEKGWWFPAKCPLSILFPRKLKNRPDDTIYSARGTKKEKDASELDLTTSDEMWSKVLRLMGGEYYHFSHAESFQIPPILIELSENK